MGWVWVTALLLIPTSVFSSLTDSGGGGSVAITIVIDHRSSYVLRSRCRRV
jgi:hypothetical protein